ncbi:hypothetical protein D3C81_2309930 [compost metagenome]
MANGTARAGQVIEANEIFTTGQLAVGVQKQSGSVAVNVNLRLFGTKEAFGFQYRRVPAEA